jgi:hypothetical protein
MPGQTGRPTVRRKITLTLTNFNDSLLAIADWRTEELV